MQVGLCPNFLVFILYLNKHEDMKNSCVCRKLKVILVLVFKNLNCAIQNFKFFLVGFLYYWQNCLTDCT